MAADLAWLAAPVAALLAACLVLVPLGGQVLARDGWFYPLFAVALSAAVPVLGLYLVFALLIGPALWTRRGLAPRASVAIAMAACLLGLGVSWAADWPSGACVALALCTLGIASGVLPRAQGGQGGASSGG
ncbi:MAG: hypothetical protein EOO24_14620 [Comamonadaceae bacterium]|nr:MAG: hypothetical protein EOO24_14620 [Comamonadaceae bacterium]